MFTLPRYQEPDFAAIKGPNAKTAPAPTDGVAPENYHALSIFPEAWSCTATTPIQELTMSPAAAILAFSP